jgi:chemotaxis signal transduction protein
VIHLVEELLPNMRRVLAADRDLRDLGLLWTMIEASSAIGCPKDAESILPTLSQTRERFAQLQTQLVRQLGLEILAELRDELTSTAQCSIDILVRNLYERTADVGFLATDDVLRNFCAMSAEDRAAASAAFVRRLSDYREKYTVYDDIIVLDLQSQVLARLDPQATLTLTRDGVVAEAVSRTGYVERYGRSDLAADERPALLYGHRIDNTQGRCIGVLVLRFRLADELERVFGDLVRAQRPAAVLLVDDRGTVLQSNDETHVALGARLQTGGSSQIELTTYAGREYLAVTCPTRGYQGYKGPGWRAVTMVSLVMAFRSRHDETEMQEGVALDSEDLRRIQTDLDGISRNLRRVVWNGRLVADSGRGQLKAILQQVNDAGSRMRERAGRAIRDLYRTALGRARQQAAELARLAADIMDRNLYERANDCRWWALSPVLQNVLSQPADAAGTERLNAVLATINRLYTVYTRLVVFDASGTIRGVSNDDLEPCLQGSRIAPELLQAALSLGDSQRYAVSPFGPTALNGNLPTYVYLAAVRPPGGGSPVGGIAIVFNAEREFRAMLQDVLDGRAGIAAFIDGEGRVVASTDASHIKGQPLPLSSADGIIELGDANFSVASVPATGYREFKSSDGYHNDVRAVVALRLGKLERRRTTLFDRSLRPLPLPSGPRRPLRELAIFEVGPSRYALPMHAVMEARSQLGMVRLAKAGPCLVGLLEVASAAGGTFVPVLCARMLFGVEYPARATDGTVLVLADPGRPGHPLYGFRVDDVISVIDVDERHIQPAPAGLRVHAPWLESMVRLSTAGDVPQEVLAQLLDPRGLAVLVRPSQDARSDGGLSSGTSARQQRAATPSIVQG